MAPKTTGCCAVPSCGKTVKKMMKSMWTKRWRCAGDIESDSNAANTQVWVTVFIMWSLLLCLYYRLFDMYWVFMHFWPKSQQRPSMKDVAVKHTTIVSQSQQWAFTSESTIRHVPIQTDRSDGGGGGWGGGVKNRAENSLLLLNYNVFWC